MSHFPENPYDQIQALRQRVAELEKERDAALRAYESAEDSVLNLKETRNRVTAERDEAYEMALNQTRIITTLKSALREAKVFIEGPPCMCLAGCEVCDNWPTQLEVLVAITAALGEEK